jgi:hypothetical protein
MMVEFYELPPEDRYGAWGTAGDIAEAKVAKVLEDMDRPCVKIVGRHDTARAQHTTWHPMIQALPDFLGWGRFIEVQGSAGDYVIFKEHKLEAMLFWHGLMPVFFGIYNSRNDEVIFCDLSTIYWAINTPDIEIMTLDASTKNPKVAYKVPLEILLERRVSSAFEADRIAKGKRKRKAQGESDE